MRRSSLLVLAGALVLPLVLPGATALASEPAHPSVVRDAMWFLGEPGGRSTAASWRFGRSSDVPFYGDWDGDGVATPGVYRDGTWYLRNSNSGGAADIAFYYGGRPDDVPVVGDWDGDGIDTVGVIRGGTWFLVNELRGGEADASFIYGRVPPRGDDVPLVGDWDGDGVDTVGIVRDGTWHLRNRTGGGASDLAFVYGRVGPRGDDVAVTGDWDGDGVDTVGIVRGRTWYVRNQLAGGRADEAYAFGLAEDQKLVADRSAAALAPREAIRVWFGDQPDKAIDVARCESNLDPRAYNSRGFYGLFQISSGHRAAFERVTGQRWEDGIWIPYYNAQYARTVYESAGGWSPWPKCGR